MALAKEDQPAYKISIHGKAAVSDSDLLSVILRGSYTDEVAREKAETILKSVNGNLNEVAKLSIHDLEGLGCSSLAAGLVVSAMELGRRRQLSRIVDKPSISCSIDGYNAIAFILQDLPHEEFWVLILNRANRIIHKTRISSGGIAGTVVDMKMLFAEIINKRGSSAVLVHNHPSGTLRPSKADIDLTKKAVEAGKMLDILILDHLIIGERGYYSFADEGLIS